MRAISGTVVAMLLSAGCRIDRPPESGEPVVSEHQKLAEHVAARRGLSIERPIERSFITREQHRAQVPSQVSDEERAELAAYEVAMKRLGMLPADYEFERELIDLHSDQLRGYYDPEKQRLYLIGWAYLTTFDEGLMVHEIDHALQDQHFDLIAFQKGHEHESDARAARGALIEGDASALTFEYLYPFLSEPWKQPVTLQWLASGDLTAGLDPVAWPLVLLEGRNFPYLAGTRFVAHMRQHHPWSRIDEIYRQPPLSTEHILHPIKYEAYELPDRIEAKLPPTLADHSSIYDDVIGELGWGMFLRQHGVEPEMANMAAQGWGGDRLVIHVPSGYTGGVDGTIGVSYSVWDHADEAREFFDALTGVTTTAERRGDAVMILFGVPSDRAASLREEIWSTWTATRR
jgi:hypothetical protein